MTALAGMMARVQAWFASLWTQKSPEGAAPGEAPMLRLQRILVGIATPAGRRSGGLQLMIDSLNREQLTCKSRELLAEGDELELQLLLTGVGPVSLTVVVEWVLLSSYGHSAGLRVVPNPAAQQALEHFVALQQAGLRGK